MRTVWRNGTPPKISKERRRKRNDERHFFFTHGEQPSPGGNRDAWRHRRISGPNHVAYQRISAIPSAPLALRSTAEIWRGLDLVKRELQAGQVAMALGNHRATFHRGDRRRCHLRRAPARYRVTAAELAAMAIDCVRSRCSRQSMLRFRPVRPTISFSMAPTMLSRPPARAATAAGVVRIPASTALATSALSVLVASLGWDGEAPQVGVPIAAHDPSPSVVADTGTVGDAARVTGGELSSPGAISVRELFMN
jgi:hypothetical protein